MKNLIIIIPLSLLIFILIFIIPGLNNKNDEFKNSILIEIERAYFEGQKDAIEGDIRIVLTSDSITYEWSKSPWDDDSEYSYNPKTYKK